MQLQVVGCSGSQPGRGQACSGYLVTTGATRVLLDCGFGVAARLTALLDPSDLDAIVVTHRHWDHSIDLIGLFRILLTGDQSVPVYAAAEVREAFMSMVRPGRRADWERVFPWTTVGPGDAWSAGDLSLVAHDSDHPVPTVSLRLTDPPGATLVYSSDSSGNTDLVSCATGADVLLAEASWQVDDPDREGDGHMTAARAGEVATEAGVAELVLTHLRPHLDPGISRDEAAATYAGPIAVARDDATFPVVRADRAPATSR